MNTLRRCWLSSGFCLAATLMAHGAMAADVNVSGAWKVTITSSATGTRETTMSLTQKGTELTGTIRSSSGKDIPVTGSISGPQIKLSYTPGQLRVNNGSETAPLQLDYIGTVKDNTIEANATALGGLGEARMVARRK